MGIGVVIEAEIATALSMRRYGEREDSGPIEWAERMALVCEWR